jgi:hypothetical protein
LISKKNFESNKPRRSSVTVRPVSITSRKRRGNSDFSTPHNIRNISSATKNILQKTLMKKSSSAGIFDFIAKRVSTAKTFRHQKQLNNQVLAPWGSDNKYTLSSLRHGGKGSKVKKL